MSQLDLSIVVPLFNEDESLPELTQWISRVMDREGYTYEIIFVNDGSTDNSWKVIQELSTQNTNVKAISFRKNQGKSAGLNQGFKAASGQVVITMDADLQDSPEEIPELRKMILEDGYDLVSGWKQKRYDPISTNFHKYVYCIHEFDYQLHSVSYNIQIWRKIGRERLFGNFLDTIPSYTQYTKVWRRENCQI